MTARKSAVASSEHSSYRALFFFLSFVSVDNRKKNSAVIWKSDEELIGSVFFELRTTHNVSVLFFSLSFFPYCNDFSLVSFKEKKNVQEKTQTEETLVGESATKNTLA